MAPNSIPPGDLGNWSNDDIHRFELAQHILRMIIGAYSGRMEGAPPAEEERLLEQQASYAAELRQLDAEDTANLERIIAEYPELLRQVRDAR
jgi:hypothetical protein